MKPILCLFLTLILSSLAAAEFPTKAVLAGAPSTESIIAYVEEHKGFGYPQWAEFSNGGKKIFTIWNDPFSGRSATYVQAYYYDGKQWALLMDEFIQDTSFLSPMISTQSHSLLYYAGKNKLVLSRSLDDLKPLGKVGK